jgi:hypothetical protein
VLAGKRFAAYVVCRRYWSINLKEVRKLGTAQRGEYADGTRFQFAGGFGSGQTTPDEVSPASGP